jgi:hypothetical protein
VLVAVILGVGVLVGVGVAVGVGVLVWEVGGNPPSSIKIMADLNAGATV